MIELYVLNKNLETIDIIDTYKSLIWVNKYNAVGECELYITATTDKMSILKKGNYLIRLDDDMICQIKKVELNTDAEDGNYLIVTGFDCKSFLHQRVVWGSISCNGNVEDFIRLLVNESLCEPDLSDRQLKKENGQQLFSLGDKANFTEVIQEQTSYDNVGEKVEDYCNKYDWGYRVVLKNELLHFSLYRGIDRSNEIVFSNDFGNLIATKYVEDETNIGNVALIAGEGEGAKRSRTIGGQAEGIDRYEIYVDARDISKTITWEELKKIYPMTNQGGVGSIQRRKASDETYYYVYTMEYLDVTIIDDMQLAELETSYPAGERITINGNLYYRAYSVDIADLPSDTLEDSNPVVLKDIVYSVYLLNKGYEKMAEYGKSISFEGTIEPNITFIYKQDYFLGDLVKVQNEYGVSVNARIVEVVEVNDDNGYRVEPNFEYLLRDG